MRARYSLLLFAPLTAVVLLSGCVWLPSSVDEESSSTAETSSPDPTTTESVSVACDYVESGSAAVPVDFPPTEPEVAGDVDLVIQTSAGELPITLTADRTPCTVGSFVSLAEQGYFDATNCHRLTTDGIFVLQCGDPTGTGTGGPGYSFVDELDGSEEYPAGTVAMANAGPDTNGSQFFLVYEDTLLPPDYTVFGEISPEGVDVLREVAEAGTESGGTDGPPAEPVTILRVEIS